MSVPSSVRVTLGHPIALAISSPLAKAAAFSGKGPGRARWKRKLMRSLFSVLHQRLRLPASGRMTLGSGASFRIDARETTFLEFAARTLSEDGFEPEVTALLTHLAGRLAVVYDVGANWGYYPLLLAADPRFRGRVHAFEIRPQTAAILSHVVRSAGLEERIDIHPFGLSNEDGNVRLSRERHSYLCRVVGEEYRGPTDRVAVRRLDGVSLPPPDLVKIDVEGHEAAVLSGASRLLARHRPLVVFESWHDGDEPQRMLPSLEILARQGYALFRPVWQPDRGRGSDGTLLLEPLAAAERLRIAGALNLFAVPPERAADFF